MGQKKLQKWKHCLSSESISIIGSIGCAQPCGSIGNIKISHQHSAASIASIALCHQYWSATVNNQGNPPTWQIPTLCSPKPHQYYPIVILALCNINTLVCIFRTSPIL